VTKKLLVLFDGRNVVFDIVVLHLFDIVVTGWLEFSNSTYSNMGLLYN
ncbi:MAG: hypothetical protein ACI8RD_009915, partial [Bacillariaceae sp.]|jgi:hypothetical protein